MSSSGPIPQYLFTIDVHHPRSPPLRAWFQCDLNHGLDDFKTAILGAAQAQNARRMEQTLPSVLVINRISVRWPDEESTVHLTDVNYADWAWWYQQGERGGKISVVRVDLASEEEIEKAESWQERLRKLPGRGSVGW